MIMKMYCIFDILAEQSASGVFLYENEEILKRALSDSSLSDTMEKHPEDFDLICLGEFDTSNLNIVPCRKLVAHISTLRKVKAEVVDNGKED